MRKNYKNISDKPGETLTAKVRPQGNGACVIVPKKWLGKTVEVKIIE